MTVRSTALHRACRAPMRPQTLLRDTEINDVHINLTTIGHLINIVVHARSIVRGAQRRAPAALGGHWKISGRRAL